MRKFFVSVFLVLSILSVEDVFAQQSSWKTSNDGWVMRKSPDSKTYKKFFALGLWNVPGYNLEAMEENPEGYRKKARLYLDNTPLYNSVYISAGTDKEKLGRVEITGSIGFYKMLLDWEASIPGITKGADRAYSTRQYTKAHVNDASFTNMLDSAIDQMSSAAGDVDHIWAPIDEIVNGGAGSGWCWHPEVGAEIRKRIRAKEKNTLVFTDLVGIARGNSFLFEQNYLKSHANMPANPPYEALGEGAKVMDTRPLLGFIQSYDGKPVYVNGTADYTDYDLPTLKNMFYENLRICSKAYKDCGDVFGINAFIDCNTHPALAGTAVDGIKAGLGAKTPVWMFFDGNGYAKPSNLTAEEFVENLKCQIYTAIIHGATGVLFWNDRSLAPDVFNELEKVVAQLSDNENLICMDSIKTEWKDDLHYTIKKNGKSKVLIATNSNPVGETVLDLPGVCNKTLAPLEVLILNID